MAIDLRLIDPTPDDLARALGRASRAADRGLARCRLGKDLAFWRRFVRRARSREGRRCYNGSRANSAGAAFVGVAWWTDAVGRRHWRVEGRRVGYGDLRRDDFRLTETPLWHVYPDRLLVRGDEVIAFCGCGEIGPPASLAWTGERCGPCHDRGEEGLPAHAAEPAVLRLGERNLNRLAFAGPEVLAVCVGAKGIVKCDLRHGGSEPWWQAKGWVSALAAGPGVAAISVYPGAVRVLTAGNERPLGVAGVVHDLRLSPDGRRLAVAGTLSLLIDLDGDDARVIGVPGGLGLCTFAADGRSAWGMDFAGALYRIDPEGRAETVRARPGGGPHPLDDVLPGEAFNLFARGLACSADGRWLAASFDGQLPASVGDLRTGRWFDLEDEGKTMVLGFRGDRLVSADVDGAVRLWDLKRRRMAGEMWPPMRRGGLRPAALSPDGERVALTDDAGGVRLLPLRALD